MDMTYLVRHQYMLRLTGASVHREPGGVLRQRVSVVAVGGRAVGVLQRARARAHLHGGPRQVPEVEVLHQPDGAGVAAENQRGHRQDPQGVQRRQ